MASVHVLDDGHNFSQRQPPPTVSVVLPTYNHENFIAVAIESAVRQETNFNYEIVVGEDCSTDKTREIVASYADRYPQKIRALFHEKNLGGAANFDILLNECRGEFVAILEGDDYWISPGKLQRQVEFLRSQMSCPLCFHSATVVRETGISAAVADTMPDIPRSCWFSFAELVEQNPFATCTAMFRRELMPSRPGWMVSSAPGDWLMWLFLAQHGPVGYFPDKMGVYRLHPTGMWSGSEEQRLERIFSMYQALAENVAPENRQLFDRAQSRLRFLRAVFLRDQGKIDDARSELTNYLARRIKHDGVSLISRTKFALTLNLPGAGKLRARRHKVVIS